MQRLTAHFSGRVQGVGFRYTTARVARGFVVAGYVMNLPDGQVELVAEGEAKELQAFLAAVRDAMGRNIADTRSDIGAASGEFGDASGPGAFSIRH
ncbi:MAG: acylphosphatase [Phycisphaerales bacterium]